MMGEAIAANLAGMSATVGGMLARIAADGAQICTDGEAVAEAFAEVFGKLAGGVVVCEEVGEIQACQGPKLPQVPVMVQELVEEFPGIDEPEVEEDALELKEEGKVGWDAPVVGVPVEVIAPPGPPEPVSKEEQSEIPVVAKEDPKEKRRAVEGEKVSLPQEASKTEQTKASKPEVLEPIPQEQPPLPVREQRTEPESRRPAPEQKVVLLPAMAVENRSVERPVEMPAVAAERAFVAANHPKIVTEIQGRLLPDGGSMHIRLDPPELGALAVQIDVRDGVVVAMFSTSTEEATRLLSHSLGQLRHTLETAGVSVEKLAVQQAPREHFSSDSQSRDHERGGSYQAYERSAQDDQQRREMLARMWRRLAVGRDMLDLVA